MLHFIVYESMRKNVFLLNFCPASSQNMMLMLLLTNSPALHDSPFDIMKLSLGSNVIVAVPAIFAFSPNSLLVFGSP
jgi:hypothetical protein